MHSLWRFHLILFFILVHLNSGLCGNHIMRYSRAGSDVTIQCPNETHPGCNSINWTYKKNKTTKYPLVIEGKFDTPGNNRLRLEPDCSLHIGYVTTVDAGMYICRKSLKDNISVQLAVISVFSSIHESKLKVNDTVTIHCLLHTYDSTTHCNAYKGDLSLEWVGSDHHDVTKSPCNISTRLTLTRNQLGRKVHCRLKRGGVERASAVYTLSFSERREENVVCESAVQMEVLELTIALTAALAVVACVALLVVLRKQSKNKKVKRKKKVGQQNTEEEHTYIEVHPKNPTHAEQRKRVSEESVTYSVVKANTSKKRKTQDFDPYPTYATVQ
ncbi:uncharacterized protein LOC121712145 isoform X2 [Alosa sapidissima]|uniref:uncharacterized protein LOC121712145 isoform X2 n=1 Tax=Alosa sapidissima TaxID=34773 RepID=UPI001C0830D4|nr:uncharacterized protein LOC121712145 isoform X2 [Alosa sapidissima]